MADEKKTQLSIVIRTVDQATAKLKAINDRLDAVTKPFNDFKKQLSSLKEKSGLDAVADGFKGVGGAVTDLLGKIALIGGVLGAAVVGVKSMIDEFDRLGDKAEHIGVGVDFLAQMRYAAEKSGAEVETLDAGLQGFVNGLGLAKAGTGKLAGFLKLVSPELLKQVKAAKSSEEALGLLADAMVKIKDPAKRAAFAQKTLGDASLAPLLAKGAKGIQELRDQSAKSTGPLGDAVKAAGDFGDSMDDLKATTMGVKAALVVGLAPALKKIVERLREWFSSHNQDIKDWARDIGEKLPGAVDRVVTAVGKAWDKVTAFVDAVGGLKNVAIGAAAIMAGPMVLSVVKLSSALVTAIARVASLRKGLAAVNGAGDAATGAAGAAGKAKGASGGLAAAGPIGATIYAASLLNDITGGSIGGDGEGAKSQLDIAQQMLMQRPEFAARTSRWEQFLGKRPQMDTSGMLGALRAGAAPAAATASVTVKFEGAPKGTRATTDPKSTANVDLSVGYQLGGAM